MAQSTFLDFASEQLPAPPARVLEVGCGQGELTTTLAVAGYDVLGIDPLAPQGERFRRILLEDLQPEDGPYDAVVASHSLHHIRDLDHALDRIVGRADLKAERRDGRLVVRAFHREDGVRRSGALDDALDRALDRLARTIGLEEVVR